MTVKFVVICDSRGRYLQDYLPADQDSIRVLFYSGVRLNDLLYRSYDKCLGLNPKYNLVHGGICNMSIKDRSSGSIDLVYKNEVELLDHMCLAFTTAWELARSMYPGKDVIFSGLCRMDLNKYNGFGGYHPHQPIIDSVIEQLNHHITGLNYQAGVYLPKMTSKVHKRNNRKGHRNQYRLLPDGIHPGPVVLKDWATNIHNLFKLLNTRDAHS